MTSLPNLQGISSKRFSSPFEKQTISTPEIEEKIIKEKKEKIKNTRCITREIAEDISREYCLGVTLKDTIFYAIYIIFITLYALIMRHFSLYYLTAVIQSQFSNIHFKTWSDLSIDYSSIDDISDFWTYAEGVMVDAVYRETYSDDLHSIKEEDKKILYENKLLGVPRIRQVRVKSNSCYIHNLFKPWFEKCLGEYNNENKDTEPFGLNKSTAWVYSPESVTESLPYEAKIGYYEGGGYYADFQLTKNDTLNMLKNLKHNLWITRNTRAIFIDFSVYNANMNIFCIGKLVFELPPTGGILPSTEFRSTRLVYFSTIEEYFMYFCDLIVYVFIFYYFILDLRNALYFRLHYFRRFWTWVNITIFIVAVLTINVKITVFLKVPQVLKKIELNPTKYGNLEYVATQRVLLNTLEAIKLFLVYIKIFSYLNFNKTMAQLNNTLKKCSTDVLGFSLMFFIVFFDFAIMGYLIFGPLVEDFSTLSISLFTLLRTTLGDFKYPSIHTVDPSRAPLYFFSYIFFLFFILLATIINDTYTDVKTEIAIAEEEMQMFEYVKNAVMDILKRCGFKFKEETQKNEFNVTLQQIRDAFKRCGFTNLEIEMFFARYNIDPRSYAAQYDINELISQLTTTNEESRKNDQKDYVKRRQLTQQEEKLERILLSVDEVVLYMDGILKKMDTSLYLPQT